jgi:hypothetical protein
MQNPAVRPPQDIYTGGVEGHQLRHRVQQPVQTDIDIPRLGSQSIRIDDDAHRSKDLGRNWERWGVRLVDGNRRGV